MRLFNLVALVVLVLAVGGAGCEGGNAQPARPLPSLQSAYDVQHYELEVRVRPEAKTIAGTLRMRAAVRDTLRAVLLDLDSRLHVEDVWVGGEALPPDSITRPAAGNQLRVGLPESRPPGDSVGVRVAYQGAPRVAPNPPWDGGVTWSTTPAGAPWIATSVQTNGASLWWPVKDHPSDEPDSMDIALTVPDSLVAASNGRLRAIDRTSDTTRTFRWHVSMPINAYNVTMNVAPYARVDTTYESTAGGRVPVSFYALPSDSAEAARVLPDFLRQLRFLEETLGPYPPRADKYGVAQAPFLGMEHQSLIAYGHDFSTGGLGYEAPFDALHFHELAHEWYGNLVTVQDWKDFWLHEGPATYLEALYAEHLRGDRAYHAVTNHFRTQVQGGGAIARRESTTAQGIYHRDVYFRGALLLHTLRYWVGEAALRTILRRIVYPEGTAEGEEPPFRHVTTEDVVDTAEAVTGRSLEAFFEVYLYQASLPRLVTERSEGTLTLRWEETGTVPFEVPVPVRVDGATQRVDMTGGRGQVEVPRDAEVTVDPKGWVLRAEEGPA